MVCGMIVRAVNSCIRKSPLNETENINDNDKTYDRRSRSELNRGLLLMRSLPWTKNETGSVAEVGTQCKGN